MFHEMEGSNGLDIERAAISDGRSYSSLCPFGGMVGCNTKGYSFPAGGVSGPDQGTTTLRRMKRLGSVGLRAAVMVVPLSWTLLTGAQLVRSLEASTA